MFDDLDLLTAANGVSTAIHLRNENSYFFRSASIQRKEVYVEVQIESYSLQGGRFPSFHLVNFSSTSPAS